MTDFAERGGKGGDVDCGGRRGGFLLLVVWNFECTDGVVVGGGGERSEADGYLLGVGMIDCD